MNKLFLLVFFGFLTSCSEEEGVFFTYTGKVVIVEEEGVEIPYKGAEVFIRVSKCESDGWFTPGVCNFIEVLDERSFSDASGNYSLTFFLQNDLSYAPEIIVPKGYKMTGAGGREQITTGNRLEYNFLLAKVKE